MHPVLKNIIVWVSCVGMIYPSLFFSIQLLENNSLTSEPLVTYVFSPFDNGDHLVILSSSVYFNNGTERVSIQHKKPVLDVYWSVDSVFVDADRHEFEVYKRDTKVSHRRLYVIKNDVECQRLKNDDNYIFKSYPRLFYK